jgi:eukaryotic-like serine/threonine-protein kinase
MNSQIDVTYSFGNYLLDVSEKRLLKDNTVVHLTPKAFDTLVVLVASKGRIVEKDALLDEVWTDTFVEEGTLAQNILTLRKTLGTLEDGKQFIETVPRRGYRFIADVREIVRDDEFLILERRVKTEITAEHKAVSDEDAIAVNQPQTVTVSQPNTFFGWFTQNRMRLAGAIFVCVLLFATVAFSVRYALQPEKFSSSEFNKIEVSKLTSDGSVFRGAISPDGKYLALVERRDGNQLIRVKQTDAFAAIEILPPKKQTILGLAFSPDGKQIYFVSYDEGYPAGSPQMGHLFRVPMLGGTPQEMLEDIDSVPAISPDGRQIAFIRNYLEEKESVLIISEIERKNERRIVSRNLKEAFSANGLSWSPDGKAVACTAYVTGEVGKQMDAFLVDAATSEQKSLTKENWLWIGQTAWLADGSGVIFPAWNSRSGSSADEIWLVPVDGGDARQISSGINGVFSLSLTADSKSIMAVKTDRLTDFWISSAADLKKATKILQNHAEYNMSPPGVNWSPNERIVFGSTFNGNLDIWTMNPDGSNRQQLTLDKAADFFPAASVDGQTIVFISNRSGRENLWRMKADGNKQEQVTSEINVSSPSIAPDNRTVYYSSLDEKTGRYLLRKINMETGESAQITSLPTLYPRLSPDGKYIACYFPEAINAGNFKENSLKLTVLSAENGEVFKQFDAPYNQNRLSAIEWKGAQSISYLTSNRDDTKLWEQPISGGEARVLLELPETSVFRFAWSQDGQRLIYEKGVMVTDAILINSKD